MLDGVQDPEGLLPPSPGVPDPIPIVPWDEEDDDLGDYGDRGGDLLEQYGQHADGGEEEEEAEDEEDEDARELAYEDDARLRDDVAFECGDGDEAEGYAYAEDYDARYDYADEEPKRFDVGDRHKALLEKMASEKAQAKAEAERKAARAVGFKGDQVLPLRAPSQGDGGGGAAAADDAFSGASAFFRLSGPQRAEVLLLVALWAGGYGRGSAQLFDAATLEPLRWAATTLFFGHVLIAAYGTLFVALPRGLPPVPWALKLVLTGAGGLGELRAIEGGGGGEGGE